MINSNIENDQNIKNVPEPNSSRMFGAKISNQTKQVANQDQPKILCRKKSKKVIENSFQEVLKGNTYMVEESSMDANI